MIPYSNICLWRYLPQNLIRIGDFSCLVISVANFTAVIPIGPHITY